LRRKEKEITNRNEIEEILTHNTICRIALSDNNIPYLIPMNYGYKENKIFLHSAGTGKKIEIIYQTNYRLTTCKLRIIYKESRNTGKDYS